MKKIIPMLMLLLSCQSSVDKKADQILKQMSLESKVAQMIQAEIQSVTPEDIKKYKLGSILNGGGSFPGKKKDAALVEWVELANKYYLASMNVEPNQIAIPIIWGTDAVHGHNNVWGATIYPHNIGLGATRNPVLIEDIAEMTAKSVAATGMDWIFAPTVAVVRDDRWGRTYEGYSEDPDIVKAYASKMVEGIQKTGIIATAKHFVGDGGTKDGIDQGDNILDEDELLKIHSQGYISAINSKVMTVMASFNSWKGYKVHGNRYLLTELLKKKMGFEGFVIGDWNGHGQVEGCSNESCPQAINAGVDMIMVPNDWKKFYKNTLEQVRNGVIPTSRIDDAVKRILKVKIQAGLFEAKAPVKRPLASNDEVVYGKKSKELARQAVRESLVLLKNNKKVLPIKSSAKVLIAGSGAHNIGKQMGGWSLTWQGIENSNKSFPNAVSIYEGIAESLSDKKNIRFYENKEGFDADVAILVIGEKPYAEGQGDIKNLNYIEKYPNDLEFIKKLQKLNIPIVTVFLSGRPLWVNPLINRSESFVAAWLPGSEGDGIADVLIGDSSGKPRYDFKGKLTFSWPNQPTQFQLNYKDTQYKPLFKYGYGLNYQGHSQIDQLSEDITSIDNSEKELSIFKGRVNPAYQLYADKQLVLIDGLQDTHNQVLIEVEDKEIQADSFRVQNKKSNQVNLEFRSQNPKNFSQFEKIGFLNMVVKVRENSTQYLGLKLLGADAVNLYNMVDKSTYGSWSEVSIPVKCFNNNKINWKAAQNPVTFVLKGITNFSFNQISIDNKAKYSQVDC